MKARILSLALAVLMTVAAPPAWAACFADYKAKRDNPLRLHYGVIQLPDGACGAPDRAAAEIAGRIGRDGWELLTVEGTFGDEGLDRRRANAGDFFLRY